MIFAVPLKFTCIFQVGGQPAIRCPPRTKVWSSTFFFAAKLTLGLNNSRKKIELFRPRVTFDATEKVELQTFVLEGHPSKQCEKFI